MTTADSDHNLLLRMLESQGEMKALLKSALARQDKTDERIESIASRVTAIEMDAAKEKGRTQLIGTGFGIVGGGIMTIAVAFFKERLGF